MKKIHFLAAAVLACASFAPAAWAGAKAVGVELTVSKPADFRAAMGGKVEELGTNAYSDGPMWRSAGVGLEIEGLQQVLAIFDVNQRLSGLQLTLDKHRYDAVMAHLKGKYRLKGEQRPFVGNRSAVLEGEGAVIEVEAPHLSFQMTVTYFTPALKQAFTKRSADSEAAKARHEGGQF